MTSPFQIRPDDLSGAAIRALIGEHLADMASLSPPESIHALDLSGLTAPDVRLWSVWEGDRLVGCGALKHLDEGHGEVKSMRTARDQRRRGVAAAVLEHLVAQARARGYRRLSLETGSQPGFAPARRFYARHGFEPCEPFADYRPDPNSVFMTRVLGPAG